ncbi:MAG: GNAT family N-acetyltransferase [Magnetococcales bacterium]|nr:GNAT family N-acetyltransferase [Magnetococcales bacterium]
MTGLAFRIDTASPEEIRRHLSACDDRFIPPLSPRVAIPAYAEKLRAHAMTVEAWDGARLVGLVAIYWNDIRGYITNVSVEAGWAGRGVGSALLAEVVTQARRRGVASIELEVGAGSEPALRLYRSAGFVATGAAGGAAGMIRLAWRA